MEPNYVECEPAYRIVLNVTMPFRARSAPEDITLTIPINAALAMIHVPHAVVPPLMNAMNAMHQKRSMRRTNALMVPQITNANFIWIILVCFYNQFQIQVDIRF